MPRVMFRAFMCATVLIVLGGNAVAQSAEQATVRVSQAVELPSMTLPPGEYELKILTSPAKRHIVQVFEAFTGRVVVTALAVPTRRKQPAEDALTPFSDAPVDAPQPVRYWNLADGTTALEFVYPREQAMRIAEATGERVLTAETTDVESMKRARVTVIDGATRRARARLSRALTDPARPAVLEAGAGVPVQTPRTSRNAPAGSPLPSGSRDTLPDTSSGTPMAVLVGLVALVGVVAVRGSDWPL